VEKDGQERMIIIGPQTFTDALQFMHVCVCKCVCVCVYEMICSQWRSLAVSLSKCNGVWQLRAVCHRMLQSHTHTHTHRKRKTAGSVATQRIRQNKTKRRKGFCLKLLIMSMRSRRHTRGEVTRVWYQKLNTWNAI